MKRVNQLVKKRLDEMYDELEVLNERTEDAYRTYLENQNEARRHDLEIIDLKKYLDIQQVPYTRS